MVRILVVLVVYCISLITSAQNVNSITNKTENNQTFEINVEVNNVSSDNGKVYFALYDSQKGFLERKNIQGKEAKINNGIAKVNFSSLIPNTYAVVCFHDANGNGTMDFEANGMPLEDYGATNNVMNFGPPQFSDAKFELVDKDLTFEIKF